MEKISKRILVVEDDKHVNRLISYNLSKNGFKPESVFDGSVAKESLIQGKFDVVILDIMLPGVDGFNLCKLIKENKDGYKTFVIIVSAKVESQDKLYGRLLGADCYLAKPFSIQQLMDTINEFISLQDKEYQVFNKYNMNKPTQRKEEANDSQNHGGYAPGFCLN